MPARGGRDLNKADTAQTAKGFTLREFLERYGVTHLRPEEMQQGIGKSAGDAANAADDVKARGHSERLVKFFQSFKMLHGRPLPRDQWPYIDYMLFVVAGVQISLAC